MNAQTHPASTGDVITSMAGGLAALAILTMALFPLAIPCLILTLALAAPLVLPLVAIGALAAAAAAPVMAVRGLRRRAAGHAHPSITAIEVPR
jgi:hypothetical protein